MAAASRGRGASRGGAAAAAYEAVTVEIAAQRAREETERFLLPESLVERVQARELEPEDDGPSGRKRKRPASGKPVPGKGCWWFSLSFGIDANRSAVLPSTGETALPPVLQARFTH